MRGLVAVLVRDHGGRVVVIVLMIVVAVTVFMTVRDTVGVRVWVLMLIGHGPALRRTRS